MERALFSRALSPLSNSSSGLTNLRGFKDLKDFVLSLEKPR